jgi:ketosteroid isomerase-like protein
MSNLDSVKAIYDSFGRGDIPAILDQLADDVQWDQDAPDYRMHRSPRLRVGLRSVTTSLASRG